jgi:hypothetical protein
MSELGETNIAGGNHTVRRSIDLQEVDVSQVNAQRRDLSAKNVTRKIAIDTKDTPQAKRRAAGL